ncbi:MAG: SUMF1/EgtB/PvdO family nonheme iron enzyme [Candidatus Hydrogenedentes bacterium]|nr:SUMF1/EgtB/PvdO family nonheme iron enzyme [Candidatus Hydrogenedentota bacterium]
MTRDGQTLGGYRDLEKIGEGAMGVVYRATQVSLKRKVALKMLAPGIAGRPKVMARFRREAEALARLNHPGIVQIFDVLEEEGRFFYSMELLDGGSIAELIAERGRLRETEAVRMALEAAEALACAHRHGIVHRDIKPGNLMLTADGRVKLTDFGLALPADDARLTATGIFLGTPQYMSPEQALGGETSAASDVYSLGVALYEMLAGRPPFDARSFHELCRMHAYTPAPALSQHVRVSPALERVVMTALEKEPGSRFTDGAALAAALRPLATAPEPPRTHRVRGSAQTVVSGPASTFAGIALGPDMDRTAYLEALRVGEYVRLSFREDGTGRSPLRPYEEATIPEDELAALCAELEGVLHRNAALVQGDLGALRSSGRALYDALLPPGIKRALAECRAGLLRIDVDAHLVQVPWELLHDGEHFLCERFGIGRIVRTGQQPAPPRESQSGAVMRMAILVDPLGDLPAAHEEANRLLAQLEGPGPSIALRYKARDVTTAHVLDRLADSDILHYVGHARYEEGEPDSSGWLLRDGVLDAARIRRFGEGRARPPMLIFANACRSAITPPWSTGAPGKVFGLANAFLLAGARHYIGVLTDVPDAYGATMASEFYRALRAGEPVGLAFFRAHAKTAHEFPESVAWAGHVLYGDPSYAYFPSAGALRLQQAPVRHAAAAVADAPVQAPEPVSVTRRRPWAIWTACAAVAVALVVGAVFMLTRPGRQEPAPDAGAAGPTAAAPAPPEPEAPSRGGGRAVPDDGAPVEEPAEAPRPTAPVECETATFAGIAFVRVPGGDFMMGSASSADEVAGRLDADADYFQDEHPRHRVSISRPFWISACEITKAQWTRVMGTEPWAGQEHTSDDPDSPAVYVSWEDVQAFIARLSAVGEGHFRLPTEAEWEWACRAGSDWEYSFGNAHTELGRYAWYLDNTWETAGRFARRVAQKAPNRWGLYDTHGNVWEWCRDWYGEYTADAVRDPAGPPAGSGRVVRGGGWNSDAPTCRSAFRMGMQPSSRKAYVGFRLCQGGAAYAPLSREPGPWRPPALEVPDEGFGHFAAATGAAVYQPRCIDLLDGEPPIQLADKGRVGVG